MVYKNRDKLIPKARELREAGLFYQEIANQLGVKCPDTIRRWLTPAMREKNSKYRETHREELLEKHREYYATHKAEHAEAKKQWRKANPEKRRESQKRYRAKHKDELSAQIKYWRASNKEKVREYAHDYRIEHKDTCRAYARLREAKINEYDKISQEEYGAIFEKQKGLCVYCNRKMRTTGDPNHPLYKTQEHIYPVSRGGAHSLDNLAYACRECNISKNARTVAEWKPGLLSKIGNGVRNNKI